MPYSEGGMNCYGRIVGIRASAKECANYPGLIWRSARGVIEDGEEGLGLDYYCERVGRGLGADWSGTERAGEVKEGIFVGGHGGCAMDGTEGADAH